MVQLNGVCPMVGFHDSKTFFYKDALQKYLDLLSLSHLFVYYIYLAIFIYDEDWHQ